MLKKGKNNKGLNINYEAIQVSLIISLMFGFFSVINTQRVCAQSVSTNKSKIIHLFNGKDLSGWRIYGNGNGMLITMEYWLVKVVWIRVIAI